MTNRNGLVIVCGVAAMLLLGCQNDDIRSYRAPKPPEAPPNGEPTRLLAAILPHGERTWFFKLVGPAPEVEEQKETFDQFIRSVHLTNKEDRPIEWTVPKDWKQEAGSQLRYATFHLGAKGALELTVVPLPREAADLLRNVNRWRDQLRLPQITEAELGKVSKESKVDGVTATMVDMAGTGSGKTGMSPPFASGRPPFAGGAADLAPRSPLTYTAPEGWKKLPASGGVRVAAFQISEGNQSAEVTIIPLPGPAGGLLDNIKRWRGQVSLGPASDEELRKDIRQIGVSGIAAQYVDLIGPESAGPRRQRILGAVVPRGEQTWFFKMQGAAALVEKQKAAFEAFLGSVRFDGGAGANHE